MCRGRRHRQRGGASDAGDREIGQHAVAQLPWGPIAGLFDKLIDRDNREWYAAHAVTNGWTRSTLENHIKTHTHQRGFRLQETETFAVEVWEMLLNWRLVVMPPRQRIETTHGYCYFGTGLESLARAVAAGLQWAHPMNTAPEGFDKQAF
nr:DUF1016 N-terminal domain-containing protein [Rathayibacter festucae]